MTASIYTPYTYLIGWSWLDIWYYGVSYKKGCNPNQLWTTYFTSSEYVAEQRWVYGEPDVIEVRCTFKTAEKAQNHESLIIDVFDIVKDPRFLNKHNPKGNWYGVEKHTERTKRLIKEAVILRTILGLNPFSTRADGTNIQTDRIKAKTHHLQKREDGTSLASDRVQAGIFISPFSSETFINPNLKREDGTSLASDRVQAGKCNLSKRDDGTSVGKEIALSRSENKTHHWQSHNQIKKECSICHKMVTPANLAYYHEDRCGQPIEKLPMKKCPHCNRSIPINVYNRWHGDNCKQKLPTLYEAIIEEKPKQLL